MSTSNKLLFLGTPEFAVPTLKIVQTLSHYTLAGVVTRPDAPKGRGKTLSPSPIKDWALTHDLPVWTPASKHELEAIIHDIQPDIIIIIAFGMILPKSITDAIPCLNIHASVLPKYRGASPIHAALLNHDAQTGITLMKINERMDAGDILATATTPISDDDNLGSLHDRLAQLGADTCQAYLTHHLAPPFEGQAQDDRKATYCHKLSTADRTLSADLPAKDWIARIRAFSPKPGALLTVDNTRYKILSATLKGDKIELKTVQPEGKGPMSYAEFKRGHQIQLLPPELEASPC